MSTIIIVAVVLVVLVAIGAGAFWFLRGRRTRELRAHFGPEYDRVLAESPDRGTAESTLTARRERHASLDLRPLTPPEREHYGAEWTDVQRAFMDDPGAAVERADVLVVTIMRRRGYPADDAEQATADVSVAHPGAVEHYREARRITDAHRQRRATTDDLRSAVTSYRSLVEALLSAGSEVGTTGTGGDRAPGHRGGATGAGDDEVAPGEPGHRDGSRS